MRLYRILEDKGVAYERGFEFQKERIVSLAWHQSGEVIVTGSINNIRVWNVTTGKLYLFVVPKHSDGSVLNARANCEECQEEYL